MDAHAAIAGILARQEGIEAVRGHIEAITARFPHSYALHQHWVSSLREQDREGAEAELRRMVVFFFVVVWFCCVLVWFLGLAGRIDVVFAVIVVFWCVVLFCFFGFFVCFCFRLFFFFSVCFFVFFLLFLTFVYRSVLDVSCLPLRS